MRAKLRRSSGETLTEVLLAILIVGVSIAIMSGLITTSAKLNANAKTDTEQLYVAINAAQGEALPLEENITITVTVTPEGGAAEAADFTGAKLYGMQDKLYAYSWERGG